MATNNEMWVSRDNYRKTKVVSADLPPLADGEVLVAIDKFGLTANNVSYAVSGDMIGYWGYYPVTDSSEENWGKVPVWGCASVIESNCNDIPPGERLWGFFPMASHVTLQPGKITTDQFMDIANHRKDLPALYNSYRRTKAEPELLQKLENERCLLFPLFITGWVLYDYLLDNHVFGAQQIIVGSVSSKTGFSLAKFLHAEPSIKAKIIGVTSERNVNFVESLGACDQIVTYGNETEIDASIPSVYVDMSGDTALTARLHNHLQENMVESAMVGASHWEAGGRQAELPGAKPTFFFAPGHIAKRDKEWGTGATMMKAMIAGAGVAQDIKAAMAVDWTTTPSDLQTLWADLLDNKIPPSRGLMVSLLPKD